MIGMFGNGYYLSGQIADAEKRMTGRLDGIDGSVKGLQLQVGKLTMMEEALRRCSGGYKATSAVRKPTSVLPASLPQIKK